MTCLCKVANSDSQPQVSWIWVLVPRRRTTNFSLKTCFAESSTRTQMTQFQTPNSCTSTARVSNSSLPTTCPGRYEPGLSISPIRGLLPLHPGGGLSNSPIRGLLPLQFGGVHSNSPLKCAGGFSFRRLRRSASCFAAVFAFRCL